MLKALRRAAGYKKAAGNLWEQIAIQARTPEFFCGLGVPDTFNGRFDMVALHSWLVLERLDAEEARSVSQALVNAIFYGFEDALRAQGAGDMGMTRRMKKIADAFYGRLNAYGGAGSEAELAEALWRNVYSENAASRPAAGRLAAYAMAARTRLETAPLSEGQVAFGAVPAEV